MRQGMQAAAHLMWDIRSLRNAQFTTASNMDRSKFVEKQEDIEI